MNYSTVYNSMLKQAAKQQEIDWDEVNRQIDEYRKDNELGAWGAFKKSIPISILIAGLSGLSVGLGTQDVGNGLVAGVGSGLATAGLNTLFNRHALPEEAGTSFYATL